MAARKTLTELQQGCRDGTDETSTNRFSNAIITRAINIAKDRAWNEVRRAQADYFLKTMLSTDASQTILGETYDPAGLTLTVGGSSLTLPPDCVGIKAIDIITSGYEGVTMRFLDLADPEFMALRAVTTNQSPSQFVWDIINEKTLRWAPLSSVALATRFFYFFKVADLSAGADTLQMPPALDRAVVAYAVSELLLGDYAEEAAAWENKGRAWVSEFLGADFRQSADPVVVTSSSSFGEGW